MATNQAQLVNRTKSKLEKNDLDTVQTMTEGIRKKLGKVEDKGPFSILWTDSFVNCVTLYL